MCLCALLRHIDNGLRCTVAPDTNNSHDEAQRRERRPSDVASRKGLDLGSHLLAVDVVNVLLASGLAVAVAEDLVTGFHLGAGRLSRCSGSGLSGRGGWEKGGSNGGEGGEESRVEKVGMSGGARGEEEADEEGCRGERGEG